MISVVIPSYNHEQYIGKAIESTLGQSYSDLELIIIDDGSIDSSRDIINKYTDERITRVYQENQGAHAAINRGLTIAKGEYISILNSDDTYHIDRFKECINIFDTNGNVDLISTWINVINEHDKTIGIKKAWMNMEPWEIANRKKTFASTGDYKLNALMSNFVSTTSNMIFKRKVYEEIGGMRNLRFTHDWDFLLRVCARYTPYNHEKSLVNYRIHGDNTISKQRKWMLFEVCWIMATHVDSFASLLLPDVKEVTIIDNVEKMLESFNFQGNEHVVQLLSWQIAIFKQKGIINPEEIFLDNEKIRNKFLEYIKG